MGTLCSELAKEGHLSLSLYIKAPVHSSKWLTTLRLPLPLSRRWLPLLLLITVKLQPSLRKSRPQRTEPTGLTRRPRSRRSSPPTEPLTKLRRRRKLPRKPLKKPPRKPRRSPPRRPQRGKLTLLARRRQLRRLPS